MTGRRRPTRPDVVSSATNLRNAFGGAVGGALATPSPVNGRVDKSTVGLSSAPAIGYQHDVFPVTVAGAMYCTLTFAPINESEHVYILHGVGDGLHQRYALRWTRFIEDNKLILISALANLQPGDTVVVEYAYYMNQPADPMPISGDLITFDEYPRYTHITTQYQSYGAHFGGDSPYIEDDGATPTSPTLSGTPRFFGDIIIYVVDPETGAYAFTNKVSLSVGYIDNPGEIVITVYDFLGNVDGVFPTTVVGINYMVIEFPNIWSVSIGASGGEGAGFALDNVKIG